MSKAVLHSNIENNLRQQDQGEGLVRSTFDLWPSAESMPVKETLMTVSSTNASYNGLWVQEGSINIMSDSRVDLDLRFYDRKTMERLTMPKLAFTVFFNLVTDQNWTSMQSVTVGGFTQYYLTDDTDMLVEGQPDGRVMFSAAASGTGNDTPKDPVRVTTEQKSRAVTLGFDEGISEIRLTFSGGSGSGPHLFALEAKPSLLCVATPAAVIEDRRLASLPSLKGSDSEEVYFAPQSGDWTFEAWDVHVGDEIASGDPIALVRNKDSGELRTIRAAKDGRIKKTQGYLRRGDIIRQVTQDGGLAVVGAIFDPHFVFYDVGVQVPDTDIVFNSWMVLEGDKVRVGDAIAQVTRATRGARGLQADDGSSTPAVGEHILIRSPVAGWVEHKAQLLQGVSIRHQLAGPTIATIRVPLPWWIPVVALCLIWGSWGVTSTLCCWMVAQRRQANYQPFE